MNQEDDRLYFTLSSLDLEQKEEARLRAILQERDRARQVWGNKEGTTMENYFGCSGCDKWEAPPGTPLYKVYQLEPSFSEHNLTYHDAHARVISKQRHVPSSEG